MAGIRGRKDKGFAMPNQTFGAAVGGTGSDYQIEQPYQPQGVNAELGYGQEYQDPSQTPPPNNDGPGGGGSGAAYDYTTDPVYAAYMANLDLDQTQRQQDTARRRDYLMADQTRLLDQTAQQGEQSRESISGSHESRGLFNSGARLRDISRQQSNQASREGSIREGTARQSAELESSLAQYLAQQELARQRAQLGIFS